MALSQFAPEADRLASAAAIEVEPLRTRLTGVQAAAESIPSEAKGRPAYNRAIALGLSEHPAAASEIFARLGNPSDPQPWETELAKQCLKLQRLLETPTEFRAAVARMITQQRRALRRPETSEPLINTAVR